jgi:hypothetical protein
MLKRVLTVVPLHKCAISKLGQRVAFDPTVVAVEVRDSWH